MLLGTAGGPALWPARSSPANAVIVDDVAYLVDCGYGTGRRLADAKIPVTSVRQIFITHHHSDHNTDLGNLMEVAWLSGLRSPIDAWGPPSMARLVEASLQYHAYDIRMRMANDGRIDPRPLFLAHDVSQAGVVMQDERVKVTALGVHHPPITPAFAYKFETPDRVVVFSGDTTYWQPLIGFAQGADLLVHNAFLPSAVDRYLARVPNVTRLREIINDSLSPVEDAGRVAAAAGVKRLALTHLVPAYDPTLSDDDWSAPVRSTYRGEVIIGRDLLEV
ncbi:MAG: MBL fold metallo-hydrolase [Candidatus Eremiobacteraeota bacterium]|nr:MBL fold metallo-hydrolase [Candidatus Eremiobacteraeota bacterium]